jgi:DUF4097 and DUF4098 domain-containing protein YvlB
MTNARRAWILAGFSALLLVPGCLAITVNNAFTAEEVVTKSFPVKGKPHVIIETFNGGIDVAPASEATVDVKVTKHASGSDQEEADANLKTVGVTLSQEGETIRVKAEIVDKEKQLINRGARVELKVPAGAVLDLHTSNGKITSTAATGDLSAHSSNSGIVVKAGRGAFHLSTSNGTITVDGANGSFDLESSNGGLEIKTDQARVKGHTSNGSIHLTGSLAVGEHSLATSNGNIALSLPANAAFRLDAQTSNGNVHSDFPVNQEGQEHNKNHLRGTVGENPQTVLDVHTSNGTIDIRRQK